MAQYSVADRTASVTTAVRLMELRTAATERIYITEIGVSVAVAGASPSLGIIRVNALGVTPTTPKLGQARDPADAVSVSSTAVAWATPPTLPATPIYLRRVTLPATIGAGWVWTFPPGSELVVPVSSAILLDMVAISAAVATAIDFYVHWRE